VLCATRRFWSRWLNRWQEGAGKEKDAADEHAISVLGPEPRTFKQAMHGPQSDRWRDTALLEFWLRMGLGRLLIQLDLVGQTQS